MSVRTILKSRWSGRLLVGLIALSVAILTALLLAGRAEAQEEEAANTKTKTVEPGDTLWTIAQERLAPDASPQRVAEEVERTYALNRERIGDDPNFILAGQELLLSPLLVSPVVGEEPRAPEPRVYEPATSEEGSAITPVATPAEEPVAEEPVAEEPVAEEPATGEEEVGSTAAPVAEEESSEPSSEPEGARAAGERRMLGFGILALSLLVAALAAWRLLASRPQRRRKGFGPYDGSGYYASYYDNYAARPHHQEEQQEEVQTAETEAAERGAPEPAEAEPASSQVPPASAAAGQSDAVRRRATPLRRQRSGSAVRQRRRRR